MARINSAKNFAGTPYVTTKVLSSEIAANQLVFVKDTLETSGLQTYLNTLTTAKVGHLVVVQGGTAKGTYVVSAVSAGVVTATKIANDAEMLSTFQNSINSINNAIKIDGNGTVDGIGSVISNIVDITTVADGQDTYKIKSGVLPDLAITQVYTVSAVTGTNYTAGTTTANDLIKSAITADGVQRGDVVIITAGEKTVADAVAGSYIFIADIAAKADIVDSNYVKMYAPSGTVTSVNTIAPIGGNVSLGIVNIANTIDSFVATKNEGITVGVAVNSVDLAIKSVVDASIGTINTTIGAPKIGETPATGIFARLESIETAIGTGDGNSLAVRVTNLETNLGTETANRSADDVVLKNAIESAKKIETISKTLATYTATGTGAVTINDLTEGLIFAVVDNTGEQVYPTITYVDGVPTLEADYETEEAVQTSWTIYQMKGITATLTHTV